MIGRVLYRCDGYMCCDPGFPKRELDYALTSSSWGRVAAVVRSGGCRHERFYALQSRTLNFWRSGSALISGLGGSEVTADAMRRDAVLTYRWHHSAIHWLREWEIPQEARAARTGGEVRISIRRVDAGNETLTMRPAGLEGRARSGQQTRT